MPQKHHRPDDRPSPIDFLWLKKQFEQLHHEHALILKKIEELGKIDQLNQPLADAIIAAAKKAKSIDEKVPDKTVPPVPTPTP